MRRRFFNDGGFSSFYNFENYLTIESLEDDLRVSFSSDIEYGIDGKGWKVLSFGSDIIAKAGQLISFKGKFVPNSEIGIGRDGIGKFTINKKCRLCGNVLSLLWGDEAKGNMDLTGYENAFYGLFLNCSSIMEIDNNFLPATTLASHCYGRMFSECTNLTTAPELPATALADNCYSNMFSHCINLTTAPELPATILKTYCYQNMFHNCSSLTTAPELPATTLAYGCYDGMFASCSSLTTAPALPATALVIHCYDGMFASCSKLTTAPELPATILANYCYYYMFSNCISLTTAPELPATTLESDCYSYMFSGCTSLTTAPSLPATTLAHSCYCSMFSACHSLTIAPTLPAIILEKYCYYYMFEGCSKLNYIKMLATNISATSCLSSWVQNVSSTGTFVKNPNMTSLPTGNSGIPSGWTVINDGEDSGNLITFTINSMSDNIQGEYQAEQGMTWSEWCASEYNVDNFYIGSGSNYVLLTIKGPGIAGYTHYQLCNNEGDDILGTDIISAEIYYEIY